MWLLFLFFLLQLIQCSVNPIKQIFHHQKNNNFQAESMPIKYWKHISQKRVWLSLPVITQEAMRHQTEKEHGCLHGFVSEMICSAPLTSLLLWKSGCASLGLESCSSRGVITALFTLGSVCHTGQFFSHWGVWGGLWDKQTASYTARNKPLIMQGFVILTFFLH